MNVATVLGASLVVVVVPRRAAAGVERVGAVVATPWNAAATDSVERAIKAVQWTVMVEYSLVPSPVELCWHQQCVKEVTIKVKRSQKTHKTKTGNEKKVSDRWNEREKKHRVEPNVMTWKHSPSGTVNFGMISHRALLERTFRKESKCDIGGDVTIAQGGLFSSPLSRTLTDLVEDARATKS